MIKILGGYIMEALNSGDISWMLVSSALVLFMTPGLAFFYGGMVNHKNAINTIMSSVAIMGLASVLWVLIGYSLSFSGDTGGIIGNLKYFCLFGVDAAPGPYAATIPHLLFAVFQMMFAIITPALITGAIVERMRFSTLFLFAGLWSILVYYPLAHMVWGGGLLQKLGALDFAGGNVVHISSGVSALVLALVIGKRNQYGKACNHPHNTPLVLLGAAILWFGWFGFNAGSAGAANEIAVRAFMTTNTSAAAAMLSWMLLEQILVGKPTLVGASTGLVVGLVAITPAAGFVPIWASLLIGGLVSPICYFFIACVKPKLGYDDALDAFGCHGIGGVWGAVATGIFADSSLNSAVKWDGLIYGDWHLFARQLASVGITILFAVVGTLTAIGIAKLLTKEIRVSTKDEESGLDSSQHGECAYHTFGGADRVFID